MRATQATGTKDVETLGDGDLVALARQGHASAFRTIMQRNNRRLYRLARSVLRDEFEAEDAVQEAYLHAFAHLSEFRGASSISTWLTRIVLNEALGRLRRRRTMVNLGVNLENLDGAAQHSDKEAPIVPFPLVEATESNPERLAAQREVRHLLEQAIDGLPEPFRIVFVLRCIEQMPIEETAACLGLRQETVKTRLHRAKRLLRKALALEVASSLQDAFPFEGARCGRISDAVLKRLGIPPPAA